MKLYLLICSMLLSVVFPLKTYSQKKISKPDSDLDIVFCLDLSGSTNGLIDNFRENIWSIVNQVNNFKPGQNLRVGIVGYSRPSFTKSAAYVKILCKLTNDYDKMTADLWKLKPEVEKGDQFVSNALEIAGFAMNWAKSKNATKILFLVGNGDVNTGSNDYRTVVMEIKEKGIQLVPVYCLRSNKTRETDGWKQIGNISGYFYEQVWVAKYEQLIKPLPATEKLLALLSELNKQCVPFTKDGFEKYNAMITCDQKVLSSNSLTVENRIFHRVSDIYLESVKSWDLVDAGFKNQSELKNADLSMLADSLKRLDIDVLFEKLQQKKDTKNHIVTEIKKLLPQSRQEYINELVSRDEFNSNENLEWVFLKNISTITSSAGINVK